MKKSCAFCKSTIDVFQLYSYGRAFTEHVFVSKFSKVLDLFCNAFLGVSVYFKCLPPLV